MLSPETQNIIKSTAPILAEHGETLTRHFYRRMFDHHPEVRSFFNPANQVSGRQQQALAHAILAYAQNIDNLGALSGAVELIAQKHASLQVKAEHYGIVGENLLASIQEVLGEGATAAVLQAWKEAYFFLADVLIARESEIYSNHETQAWVGFQKLKVARKVQESENITSFYFERLDGVPLPAHRAGQYLTLRVPSPCGHTTMRNYSLSDLPGQPWWRISVKREDGATGVDGFVSQFLHHQIQEGDELEVGPPCGEFVLDTESSRPLVLLAGGVGITPLLSMLLASLSKTPDRAVTLVHSVRSEKVRAFGSELEALVVVHPSLRVEVLYSDTSDERLTNRLTWQKLKEYEVHRDSDFYVCGPQGYMASVIQILKEGKVDEASIHAEFFGPKASLEVCPVQ